MKNLLWILLLCSSTVQAEIKMDKKLKAKLENTLNDIKRFKQEKNHKINNLSQEIELLKQKFASYKSKKEKELRKVKSQLSETKQELSQNTMVQQQPMVKEERTPVQEKIVRAVVEKEDDYNVDKAIKRALDEMIDVSEPSLEKNMVQKNRYDFKSVDTMALIPESINTPWVEIEVGEDMDIYQLAQLYYGDREKYREIYAANKQLLKETLKVRNGMSLKIPMTAEFKEQPMVLNTY